MWQRCHEAAGRGLRSRRSGTGCASEVTRHGTEGTSDQGAEELQPFRHRIQLSRCGSEGFSLDLGVDRSGRNHRRLDRTFMVGAPRPRRRALVQRPAPERLNLAVEVRGHLRDPRFANAGDPSTTEPACPSAPWTPRAGRRSPPRWSTSPPPVGALATVRRCRPSRRASVDESWGASRASSQDWPAPAARAGTAPGRPWCSGHPRFPMRAAPWSRSTSAVACHRLMTNSSTVVDQRIGQMTVADENVNESATKGSHDRLPFLGAGGHDYDRFRLPKLLQVEGDQPAV